MDAYKNNLDIMFDLMSDAKPKNLAVILGTLFAVGFIVLFSMAQVWWVLLIYTLLSAVSYIGVRSILNNVCDPYLIQPFTQKRNFTDKEIIDAYGILKRPTWQIVYQYIGSAIQVAAIIVLAEQLYLGLAFGVIIVLTENNIYNNNQKMKGLWEEYKLLEDISLSN